MKNHKKSILNQLDNLQENNPKAYWQLIDSLKDKKDDTCPIDKDDFYKHFKSLNDPPSEFKHRIVELQNLLTLKENTASSFSTLDFSISEDEVFAAIKKLKKTNLGACN